MNLGHEKPVQSEDTLKREAERAERTKSRRKRQHEEAIRAGASKVTKLDEKGELVSEIFKDDEENDSLPNDADNLKK